MVTIVPSLKNISIGLMRMSVPDASGQIFNIFFSVRKWIKKEIQDFFIVEFSKIC
jgi:hypothetical protein